MLGEKQRAAVPPTAPRCGNDCKSNYTKKHKTRSNENLQDQLGLLLWQLQSPLNKRQRRIGWRLLGVLLAQYVTISGETL